MPILSGYLDEAYRTWLDSSANCCSPRRAEFEAPRLGAEKPMRIEHHQPRLVPAPLPLPQEEVSGEWSARTRSFGSRASSRASFAVKRKLNAYNGFHSSNNTPRRPRIGAPTDFRHIDHAMPRRKEVFRPLELSIYMPENQLSPILPHFGQIDDMSFPRDDMKELPYPPASLSLSRSDSQMSFRIPRKPLRSSSRASSEWTAQFKPRPESLSTNELLAVLEHDLPRAPPPARLRSYTEPPAYERVKSALHEKFELEQRLKDIEEVIEERKSVYFNSRPTSRALSRPTSVYSEAQEPMPPPPPPQTLPSVPTPPIAPSFATRVTLPHADMRPRTAPGPSKTVHIPSRLTPFTEASAAFTTPSPSSSFVSSRPPSRPEHVTALPPPPPLPLVLQSPHPPLRKKKSFSGKVSGWLFPSEHSRNISLESVTNTPKPVTSREGFYQCIDLSSHSQMRRNSMDTVTTTVSTIESNSELEAPRTVETSWSPESSPGRERAEKELGVGVEIRALSMDSKREESVELSRVRTFGEKEVEVTQQTWGMSGHGRNSVGVAF
ncbi:hypothetical protein N431DRAFT_564699 [Stipitochalara longipes BDJ]|nr:hypothetical protein N431DRAFT_564699 [Stipitochalara longipes BDJ]